MASSLMTYAAVDMEVVWLYVSDATHTTVIGTYYLPCEGMAQMGYDVRVQDCVVP